MSKTSFEQSIEKARLSFMDAIAEQMPKDVKRVESMPRGVNPCPPDKNAVATKGGRAADASYKGMRV